jgi:hypothetical protein
MQILTYYNIVILPATRIVLFYDTLASRSRIAPAGMGDVTKDTIRVGRIYMETGDVSTLLQRFAQKGWNEVLTIKGYQEDVVEAEPVTVHIFGTHGGRFKAAVIEYSDGSAFVLFPPCFEKSLDHSHEERLIGTDWCSKALTS